MVIIELVLESSKLSRNLDPEKNTTVGSPRNFHIFSFPKAVLKQKDCS